MYESGNGLLVCDTAGVGCGTYWSWHGHDIDIVSGIELGYSYELGSGWTRIRVMTRPRWGWAQS